MLPPTAFKVARTATCLHTRQAAQACRRMPTTANPARLISNVSDKFSLPQTGRNERTPVKNIAFIEDVRSGQNLVTLNENQRQTEEQNPLYYGGSYPRRKFIPGTTYSPRDLNDKNIKAFEKKWKRSQTLRDTCEETRRDPLKSYKDVLFLSDFCTTMGHLKPKTETGLRRLNQNKVRKAVRRAKAMGLMPFTWNVKSGGGIYHMSAISAFQK